MCFGKASVKTGTNRLPEMYCVKFKKKLDANVRMFKEFRFVTEIASNQIPMKCHLCSIYCFCSFLLEIKMSVRYKLISCKKFIEIRFVVFWSPIEH